MVMKECSHARLFKSDLSGSTLIQVRYPDIVERDEEPDASLAAFDFLVSISLGLIGHRAAAHWTMRSAGGERIARRLHDDAAVRGQIAKALGVTLAEFDENAPAALEAAHGMGIFPERGAAAILRSGIRP
jgi:hypothetical protein